MNSFVKHFRISGEMYSNGWESKNNKNQYSVNQHWSDLLWTRRRWMCFQPLHTADCLELKCIHLHSKYLLPQ